MEHIIYIVGSGCNNGILEQLLEVESEKKSVLLSKDDIIKKLENKLARLTTENRSLKREIEQHMAIIDDISELSESRGAHITKLIKENKELREDYDSVMKALKYSNDQLKSVVDLTQALNSENSKLKTENESLKEKIERQKAAINAVHGIKKSQSDQITELVNENTILKNEIVSLKKEYMALKDLCIIRFNSIYGLHPEPLNKKPEEEADK